MLVSFDFLIDVICLKFYQDFYYSLLHSCFGHKRLVVGSCKSFFTDFYFLNRFHAITNLLVLFGHELTSHSILLGSLAMWSILENQDITFLSVLNSIENFNTGAPSIEIIVEMCNIFFSQSLQFSNFKPAGNILLQIHLIRIVHLHQNNMEYIDHHQDIYTESRNCLFLHKCTHNT